MRLNVLHPIYIYNKYKNIYIINNLGLSEMIYLHSIVIHSFKYFWIFRAEVRDKVRDKEVNEYSFLKGIVFFRKGI